MLAAMDIYRFFFDKWENLKEFPLAMWNQMAIAAAEASGVDERIRERLHGIAQGSVRHVRLVKEAFGNPGQSDDEIRRSMKEAIELQGKVRGGTLGINIKRPGPEDLKDVSLQQLQEQLKIVEGRKIVGQMLEVYDHYSSGWRIRVHLDQLKTMYDYHENLALGMRLRKEGYNLVMAETNEDRNKAANKVKEELRKIAHYRPHANLEFLTAGKENDAIGWFHRMKRSGRFATGVLGQGARHLERVDQLYDFTGQRFIAINDLLAEKGLPPVDYSGTTHLTAAQRDVVRTVCGAMRTNERAYLNVMKDISDFVGHASQIDRLVGYKYDDIHKRTQWVDDVRLAYLDTPRTAPGSKTLNKPDAILDLTMRFDLAAKDADAPVPLHQAFTDRGKGDVDPNVRSWRDGALAVKTIPEVLAGLTHDKKTYFEKLRTVHENVAIYSGYKPAAGRTVLYYMAGYGKMVETDGVYDFFLMNNLARSSAARRLLESDHVPSVGKNELNEFIEEHAAVFLTNLKSLAPDLYKHVEKFLGLTAFKLGDNYIPIPGLKYAPVWVDRGRLLTALVSVIIILESGKIADQVLSGKS